MSTCMPVRENERSFSLLGSKVRLLIGDGGSADAPNARLAALELEAFLRAFHRRLTRFDPESELSRLNSAPQEAVPASSLLIGAVQAALWAAAGSGGLVDPTVIDALVRNGYADSWAGKRSASLSEALAQAPGRAPAGAAPSSSWRRISVDIERGLVRRPAGLRIDIGGVGKGLAADLCAMRLATRRSFAVDAGGDLTVGGLEPLPREIEIRHPLGEQPAHLIALTSGAIATSGISNRIWRTEHGYAHHLIDPATGKPAWTGVIQATALAETALEAETLAKTALLGGPHEGERVLAAQGGVLVLDDGSVRVIGSAANSLAA
jgi:thiamine biosynthesis lipoprotein